MAPRKKVAEKTPTLLETPETHEVTVAVLDKTYKLLENTQATLECMQKKMASSAALNGGFDSLVEKIDAIHDAIYHPDEGLFARVKTVEAMGVNTLQLKHDVTELKIWHEIEEKNAEKEEVLDEVQHTKLSEHDAKIILLMETRTNIYAAGKWFLVLIAGGTLSMLGKLLINFAQGHIKFI